MAYNPYNAIKGIYDSKVAYHTNQSKGLNPNEYHRQALPYYAELAQNGYESLAAQLDGMDAVQAAELLKRYKPDEQFAVDEAYNAMTGNAQQNGGNTGSSNQANGIINAPHPNDSSIDKLMSMGTGESGMAQDVFGTAQGIATGTLQTQPSAATQGLFDAYNRENDRLNGAIQYDENGNVIGGLNTDHYNTGRRQLDYLNNFDITQQPYYQGIMDAYKLGGYNAAQGEYANGAADNGGNIDSYAAANANRQQLAFTTAGMQQAMAMANQNQQNWMTLYAQMSQDLDNQGQISLGTLDIAKQMYQTDAQERMNALDVEGSLASQQMAAAVQQFQSLVEERMKDKGITAEMAMQEKDIAAAKEQLEMQLASNERIQEGINALGYYQTDAQERMSQDSNYTQRYGYDTQLAGTQINANASMYNTKYAADRNYDVAKLEAETGLTKQQLDNMNALELQRMISENNLAVAQANASAGTGAANADISGISTQDLEDAIYAAILGQDKDALAELGITRNMTPDELRLYLMHEYGRTASEANKIVEDLQKYTEDKGQAFVMLESMFPGISEFGKTAAKNKGNAQMN